MQKRQWEISAIISEQITILSSDLIFVIFMHCRAMTGPGYGTFHTKMHLLVISICTHDHVMYMEGG